MQRVTESKRKTFLQSDIDHRHSYLERALNRGESSDPLNHRYMIALVASRDQDLAGGEQRAVTKPVAKSWWLASVYATCGPQECF